MNLSPKDRSALSKIGKIGGLASSKKFTKEERISRAKKAAAIRWGKEDLISSHPFTPDGNGICQYEVTWSGPCGSGKEAHN